MGLPSRPGSGAADPSDAPTHCTLPFLLCGPAPRRGGQGPEGLASGCQVSRASGGGQSSDEHGGGNPVTNQQRDRVVAAFDRELDNSPFPPELRSQAVRDAVARRNEPSHPRQQWPLALVAALLAVAVVATLVVGTRGLRPAPAHTGPAVSPRAYASAAFD